MNSITHLRSLRGAQRATESQRHMSAHPCSTDPQPPLALLALQQVRSLHTTPLASCLEKSFAASATDICISCVSYTLSANLACFQCCFQGETSDRRVHSFMGSVLSMADFACRIAGHFRRVSDLLRSSRAGSELSNQSGGSFTSSLNDSAMLPDSASYSPSFHREPSPSAAPSPVR